MALSAVITADIVNSTLLPQRSEKSLIATFVSILKPYKYEFYRGDSFQVYMNEPENALKIIFQIRTAARRISLLHDVRASIGIAENSSTVTKLNDEKGDAFIESGRAFDYINKTGRRLILRSKSESINVALEVISRFADNLLTSLTSKQAEVVFELLLDNTQIEAAKKLKKSQATVNKHVHSANWVDIVDLLENYQQLIAQIKKTK
ncbi:MAG TPA: hypothetical protein PKA80_13365 [Ignavibacteriaceae bacterium]|mgnify:CR=1 FL=1|nr:hypothetical protein [Ignavibacteriaceae bacterium]